MDLRIDNIYRATYPNVHIRIICTNNSGASDDCFSGEVLESNVKVFRPGYYSRKWLKEHFQDCSDNYITISKFYEYSKDKDTL